MAGRMGGERNDNYIWTNGKFINYQYKDFSGNKKLVKFFYEAFCKKMDCRLKQI